MTTSRTRGSTRLVAGVAATALLGAGLACFAAPANADTSSGPLGFSVQKLAATSDGVVVAIGSNWDDATETTTAHAALIDGSTVTPIDGVPADAQLNAVAVVEYADGPVALVGGREGNQAAGWTVDLDAAQPTFAADGEPLPWTSVDAIGVAHLTDEVAPVVAGTAEDEDGNQNAVALLSAVGIVELAENGTPSSITATSDATVYAVGTGGDGQSGELWVAAPETPVATYGVGDYPSAVVVSGGTVLVASSGADSGTIEAIDATDGSPVHSLSFGAESAVAGMALSPDGDTVYAAVNDYGAFQFRVHAIPVAEIGDYDVDTADTTYAGNALGSLALVERGGLTTLFSPQYDSQAGTDVIAGFDIYGELDAPDAVATIIGATGTVQVGQTLTGGTSGWPEGTTLSYGWGINGGQWGDYREGQSLPVTADLVGTQVQYIVTGVKGGDRLEVRSTPVAVQAAPVVQQPVVTLPTLPGVTKKATATVAGPVKVGKVVKANVGTWPKGTKVKVQWYANGKPIKGATKKSLKLTKKLKGKKISVVVTGTKAGYAPKSKQSKPTKVK